MKRFENRRNCFRANWQPLVLLGVFVLSWTAFVNAAIWRSLSVFSGTGPGSVPFPMEVLVHTLAVAPVVLPGFLLFGVAMCLSARTLRWWLIVESLAVVGTPVAFIVGRAITRYELRANPDEMGWGVLLEFSVGFLVACVIAVIADARIDYRERLEGRRRSFPFLPSVGVAHGVSVVTLLMFVLWVVLDASFGQMVRFVKGGFDVVAGAGYAWDALALRIAGLFFLASSAVAAFATLVVRQVVGEKTGRSICAMLLLTTIVAGWLGLFTAYGTIERIGEYVRLKRDLHKFKNAAGKLLKRWPTENGSLPEAGQYLAFPLKHPDTILIQGVVARGCPFRETIGFFVNNTPNGGLRFSLYGKDEQDWVEYHPDGQGPQSFVLSARDMELRLERVVKLEKYWYWTRYSEDAP